MDRGSWWATAHGVARVGHDWNDYRFYFTWSRSETRFVFLASDASFSSAILDAHSDLPTVMVLCTVLLLTKKLIPLQRRSIGSMLMALTGLVTESKLLLLPAYYCLVENLCPTLFGNPRDYSLPGSSVHGISQVRILEWVTISFSRDPTQVLNPHFLHSNLLDSSPRVTREVPGPSMTGQ